jgi:hypothetical protein
MALPVTIPNEFANATASIPLSQLDTNFTTLANAVNGISDGSETLANVTATVVNATTVDTTNIQVTNIKAKDGTAAGSIADSTGVVTLASSVLTTTDINGGTIDGAVIGGASAAAGSFTTLNTSGQVVFNDAGADVDFRVEGDTEANLLFVDASTDFVGIGTNSPAARLHSETGLSSPALILQANTAASSSSGTGTTIRFRGNANAGSPWEIFRDNDVTGDLVVAQDATGTRTERARITSDGFFKASVDGTYINAAGYHELRSNAGAITVYVSNTNASTPNGIFIYWSGASPNNTSQYFLYCQDATNEKAIIWANGNFESRTNSYGGISDVKLKQDIVDANSQWDDIKGLRVVKYRFKDEVAADPNYPSHLGVIAQEVELVSPGLIDEHPDYEEIEVPVLDDEGNPVLNEDGTPQVTKERNALGTTTKSVKYSILYMKAVKALQEAIERIETLEAKVAALEAK